MNTATIYGEDCVPGMSERLAESSVDLCVSSIPFGSLFSYSGKVDDIGNNQDGVDLRAGQFGLHMRFFIEQLFRVMKPGCNACIHIQQLLRWKVQHGYIGKRDFRGAVIDLFGAGGFEFKGEFVIPKNPQIIAQRLNLHSLMFATGKRNARDLAPAVNDYVLIFQKPGDSVPVKALECEFKNVDGWVTSEDWIRDAHGTWDLTPTFAENLEIEGFREAYDMIEKMGIAHGVWGDILEIDVLEGWRSARDKNDEKHVCPIQLEVVRRCVKLYTNPGETVLDPFMGIGSTAVVAIEQGRNAVGFELKESYHRQAQNNVKRWQEKHASAAIDLFNYKDAV